MATEKAQALVIRATDFSETSRIVTLWTRELGKVRALAKGGRRLRSNFECSLDLLMVCDIVLLRKTSGALDLLTEARVRERFPPLRHDLAALYGAYYVGELLDQCSQEYDPHPVVFDAALEALRDLGKPETLKGPCTAHLSLCFCASWVMGRRWRCVRAAAQHWRANGWRSARRGAGSSAQAARAHSGNGGPSAHQPGRRCGSSAKPATAGTMSATQPFAARSARCSITTSRICWGAGRVCYLIWGVKVVTKAFKADRTRRTGRGWLGLGVRALGVLVLAALPGCASLPPIHFPWQPDTTDTTKNQGVTQVDGKDTFVPRNGLDKDIWHPRQQDLADAKLLIEQRQLVEAEKAFHVIGADKKCPEQFREEALYFEAECQRLQQKTRAAEETYALLMKDYPSTQFTERADRALFEIALHWLEETRRQMEAYEEQREGKRWFVAPVNFIHFTQDMPIFDSEGHAVCVLEGIQMREKVMHTALGEQTLMYLATLKFYREDYLDADRYFTDLYQHYPNSTNAAKAIKQSIICKRLCTGGTNYDLRPVEESRKLIHTAQGAYPEFGKETEWIEKQLGGINLQQADRDWRIAEFYRWTTHPGSAFYYYEIVRRCYPNTEYAAKATERIRELEQRHPEAMRPAPPGALPGVAAPAVVPAGTPPAAVSPRVLPPSLTPMP